MMFILTGFKVTFTPSWRMSLLSGLALALLMQLGFWQLDRAHEKIHMVTALAELTKRAPIAWLPGHALPAQYQPLTVQGHFLPQTLLLDNQHYQHQFGYDVLSPFMLANGHVILVDRGWLAGDVTRMSLPQTNTPDGLIQIEGSAYYPSEKNWVLGQVLEKKQADLAIVERIDFPLVTQFLQKSVYPFIIRLGKHEAHGYVREWAVVAMPPERHYGYALQWFAMALVIFILFIALNIKKKL